MSVGKTNDNGNVSIFTKDGVLVYKEDNVLITYKDAPFLVGVRDKRGRMVLHTVSPTTRTMETTQAIKDGEDQVRSSEQRVRLTFNRAGHQSDVRNVRLPGQVHLDKSNQSWNFYGLATPH